MKREPVSIGRMVTVYLVTTLSLKPEEPVLMSQEAIDLGEQGVILLDAGDIVKARYGYGARLLSEKDFKEEFGLTPEEAITIRREKTERYIAMYKKNVLEQEAALKRLERVKPADLKTYEEATHVPGPFLDNNDDFGSGYA